MSARRIRLAAPVGPGRLAALAERRNRPATRSPLSFLRRVCSERCLPRLAHTAAVRVIQGVSRDANGAPLERPAVGRRAREATAPPSDACVSSSAGVGH